MSKSSRRVVERSMTPGHTLGAASRAEGGTSVPVPRRADERPRLRHGGNDPAAHRLLPVLGPGAGGGESSVRRQPASASSSIPSTSWSASMAWSRSTSRFAIAADVVCDGKYLGEITEAVVDMKAW